MPFKFGEEKSSSYNSKLGINFIKAQRLLNEPEKAEVPVRNLDEPRFMIIGRIGKEIWCGIFTVRNINIRIISVRKARYYEKEIYESF